jgi:DNA-binding response OmpR family regulator
MPWLIQHRCNRPESLGGGLLLVSPALPTRLFQHLLVLLFAHALAAFLDQRSHGMNNIVGCVTLVHSLLEILTTRPVNGSGTRIWHHVMVQGPRPRVLTVEDDDDVRLMLRMSLEDAGFDVSEAPTAFDGLARFAADRPDLVLVDLKLPDRSGFDVCRALRQTSGVPIIIVTANESSSDVVNGLDAGADDYVTKPFNPVELTARIRALLRRMSGTGDLVGPPIGPSIASPVVPTPMSQAGVMTFGDLVIPQQGLDVRRSGETVHLTRTEHRLLVLLAQQPERTFSREELLEQVWGYDQLADGRLVDVHVRRLRIKVEDDPADPRHILTVRGIGYRFAP